MDLPALQVNPLGQGIQDTTGTLQNMSALQTYQNQQALQPDQLAAARAQLQSQTALAPLEVKSAQQKSDLQSIAVQNQTLAQVAQDAEAADPEDAPKVWDAGMKAAASKGMTLAGQYVGHYRTDLADKVAEIYGDPGGPAAAKSASSMPSNMPDPGQLDVAYSKLPIDQVQKLAINNNKVIQSFNNVKDQDSWNAEIQALKDAGIPVDKVLPNTDWNPWNFATASRLIQNLVPYRDAAERAVARSTAAIPLPTAPNKTIQVGNRIYAINPQGTEATQLASADKFEYEGPEKTGGTAKVFNPVTGQVGAPGAGGAPSGSFLDFADKIDGLENGTGNPSAQNPRSSAMGNGQFINATWLQQAKQAMPQQTAGKSDDQILAMRSDPQAARLVTAAYAQQNSQTLMDRGLPVTTGTLALAHRLGPDGAVKILGASADTPLSTLLPANVLSANPDMKGQTAGQYASKLLAQIGNQPVLTPTGDDASIPGNPSLHGDAYLKSMPDQSVANQVKAIAEGREQQPSSFFLKTPYGQMMMRSLAQYDPGFDLSLYQSRVAAQTDLAKGKMGQNVTSFNTAIGHLGALDDSINRLENTSFPLINSAVNTWRSQTGDPRINSFNVARDAVAGELTRAFRGTGGSVSDIDEWKKTLDAANSPEQLHAAVSKGVDLLNSRIEATNDQYSRSMRIKSDPGNLLSPHARATLARLSGNGQAQAGAPVRVASDNDYAQLPSGSVFQGPDGKMRRKP